MISINTMEQHARMSTQELLLAISNAAAQGETEFHIAASGQHDIGGPLWNADGKKLRFYVSNPGQRVGCMGLDHTEIIVEGSAPADVGWLNSGAAITIRGDAGDTAGHCAASGVIYIGGRAGTRSGSLMKHDPLYPEPELWILRNTGSFSCEFMGGGKMIVCGWDCAESPSVLGERACTGMVGGTLYFRGDPGSYSSQDATLHELDKHDEEFLSRGLDGFLTAIGRQELRGELGNWREWRKLTPRQNGEHIPARTSMAEFRQTAWVRCGIFSDVISDDYFVSPLAARGSMRLRAPSWQNEACAGTSQGKNRGRRCADCGTCLRFCPQRAIARIETGNAAGPAYVSDPERCIGCGICAGVCPCGVWTLHENTPSY